MARSLVSVLVLVAARCVFAGGGGQNVLLVVNPNDENSLRIANAYAELRNIPDGNVVFVEPPTSMGYTKLRTNWAEFTSTYLDAIPAVISERGLDDQIDYIATVGQAHSVKEGDTTLSLNYSLSLLTPFENGLAMSQAYAKWGLLAEAPYPNISYFPYTTGTNDAIHHSDPYGQSQNHFYLSGNVGHTGRNATITADQLIAGLTRTAAADGTKPQGTIYFEDGTDVRVTTRKPYWPGVQDYLTATGQDWIQEGPVAGKTPLNRDDVRGAVIGSASAVLPNGSTYLPGSWADNLTSSGGAYTTHEQTKSSRFLVAGAGGTCGTVTEPFANQSRFTYASIYAFSNDGSTLAESFAKAVRQPDLQMFEGDMLSQAYADVPTVELTSAPAHNAVVTGSVSISAAAGLADPALATGIAQLEFYVDGLLRDTIPAGSGTFNLDTTALADGRHELRVVAVNNAAAESEGCVLTDIVVNNHGRSVAAGAGSYSAAWNQVIQVPVSAAAGDGAVSRIDLRCLGRTVGQVSGAAGNVGLDAAGLAYGANTLTPVAVYSDGTEVAGLGITVQRQFNKLAGAAETPVPDRQAGLQIEYFTSQAGLTLAETDFSGAPDHVLQVTIASIAPNNSDPAKRNIPDEYRVSAGGTNAGLAARIIGSFEAAEEGEYAFSFAPYSCRWTSLAIYIDDQLLTAFDTWNGTTFNSEGLEGGASDPLRSVYLMPGEHQFTMLLANYTQKDDWAFSTGVVMWRDAEGLIHNVDFNCFYTPEPASAVLLALGGLALLRRTRA